MRIVAFDYFRGIAILFIVAGHSYGPWDIDSFAEKVLANLITGGSALFVFISGFFFHYIYYEKYNLKEFLIKKTRYVFLPYFFISGLGIVYYLYSSEPFPYANYLGLENTNSWPDYVELAAVYLWTGRIVTAYWYVPFILIVFLLSPVFVQYIKLCARYRAYIFLVFLVISLFVHRPTHNISPMHSVIYFMSIYMLGIICSIHRDSVIEVITGKSILLAVTVLFLSSLQVFLSLGFEGYGNFHKETIFSYGGVDIMAIQKIAMCFFFLSVLYKFENHHIPGLKLLASSSFAIYFLHPWVIMVFSAEGVPALDGVIPGLGVFMITMLVTILCSLCIAYGVKLLLKKHSRYVVGW